MNSTASAPGPENAFVLHPQLERDTARVGDLPLSRVLLMNDANFPWLIVVPRVAGAVEIFDLDATQQAHLISEVALLGRFLKALSGCDKINTAAIGNIVPQLHIHVVARSRDDPAWPRPIWGTLPALAYDDAERERLIRIIRQGMSLR